MKKAAFVMMAVLLMACGGAQNESSGMMEEGSEMAADSAQMGGAMEGSGMMSDSSGMGGAMDEGSSGMGEMGDSSGMGMMRDTTGMVPDRLP